MAAKATCIATILTGALIGSCIPAVDSDDQQDAAALATHSETGAAAEAGEVAGDRSAATEAAGSMASITMTQFSPAYFGRWAMVPVECEPGRSDAKGLITIQGSLVKFYESTATLREGKRLSSAAMQGNFEFVGEGQKWEKPMRFELSSDRQRLTRTDLGDQTSYRYQRCLDPLSTGTP